MKDVKTDRPTDQAPSTWEGSKPSAINLHFRLFPLQDTQLTGSRIDNTASPPWPDWLHLILDQTLLWCQSSNVGLEGCITHPGID